MNTGIRFQYLVGLIAALAIWLCAPARVLGQSPENVAVIINDNSEDSRRIGDYYAKTRGLPPANVLRIQTTTGESIERSEFVRTIERPLSLAIRRAGLQDRLLYLVLTKGVPLRVVGSGGATGTAASVDSELTLLYRGMVGQPVPPDGRIDNPYYLGGRSIREARRFSHRDHDIYLVTRIDAFTVDQAMALIDRAQSPSRDGRIVLDQLGSPGSGDQFLAQAATRLADLGHGARVLLERTSKPARNEKGVLGYYAWAASDPENRVRSVGMEFVPGAIAARLSSFDARTFRQPPENWRPTASADKSTWFEGSPDSLVGDLVRDGVTGTAGQVGEAYAFGLIRPDILFTAYLAGFNLAEAFYLSMPILSWQAVVIGDPLCAPFLEKPLTRAEIEEPIDSATGYPGLFARRRAAVVRAANASLPDQAVAALMRSQAALERDDRVAARQALEEVVTLAPQAPSPVFALAQLQDLLGDYDAAITSYRRLLELQPDHIVALNNLAYALAVRRKAPAEARSLAERAALAAPKSGVIVDTYAWILHLLGEDELAVKLYARVVELEPRVADIRVHAAIVYAAVGNNERAAAELKEALRLDASLETRDDVRALGDRLTVRR